MTHDFEEKKNFEIFGNFILRQREERKLKQRKNWEEKILESQGWSHHLQLITTLVVAISTEWQQI